MERDAMPRLMPEAPGELPHDGYFPADNLLRPRDSPFMHTAAMPILIDQFSRECIGQRNQHWLQRFREVAGMRSRGESLRGGYYSDSSLAQWVGRQLENVNTLEPVKIQLLRSIGLL